MEITNLVIVASDKRLSSGSFNFEIKEFEIFFPAQLIDLVRTFKLDVTTVKDFIAVISRNHAAIANELGWTPEEIENAYADLIHNLENYLTKKTISAIKGGE